MAKGMATLKWGGLAMMLFGTVFIGLLFVPGVLEALHALAGPGQDATMSPTGRLGVAIYGGLMVGWGLTFHLAGRGVHITRAAAAGLIAWFVVDSGASVLVGFPFNAVSNLGFLALFAPLFLALRQTASDESEKTSASNASRRVSGSL